MINGINDELILAARLLLATLFLIFGWRKLRDFPGTVNQMAQLGVPMPLTAAAVTIFMELPVAFAVAVELVHAPAAALMFFYTLGTALIGHRYWTMTSTLTCRNPASARYKLIYCTTTGQTSLRTRSGKHGCVNISHRLW